MAIMREWPEWTREIALPWCQQQYARQIDRRIGAFEGPIAHLLGVGSPPDCIATIEAHLIECIEAPPAPAATAFNPLCLFYDMFESADQIHASRLWDCDAVRRFCVDTDIGRRNTSQILRKAIHSNQTSVVRRFLPLFVEADARDEHSNEHQNGRLMLEPASPLAHPHSKCSGCKMSPIEGTQIRTKLKAATEMNLYYCQACFDALDRSSLLFVEPTARYLKIGLLHYPAFYNNPDLLELVRPHCSSRNLEMAPILTGLVPACRALSPRWNPHTRALDLSFGDSRGEVLLLQVRNGVAYLYLAHKFEPILWIDCGIGYYVTPDEERPVRQFILPPSVTRIEIVYVEPTEEAWLQTTVPAVAVTPLLPCLWQLCEGEKRVSFVKWDTKARITSTQVLQERGCDQLTLLLAPGVKASHSNQSCFCGCELFMAGKSAPTFKRFIMNDSSDEEEEEEEKEEIITTKVTPLIPVDPATLAAAGFCESMEHPGIWSHSVCTNHVYRVWCQHEGKKETWWLVRGTKLTTVPLPHMTVQSVLVDKYTQTVWIDTAVDWTAFTPKHVSLEAKTALAHARISFRAGQEDFSLDGFWP